MRGSGDILGFQTQEVLRAYEKALQKGEDRHAANIRASHPDLEHRFKDIQDHLVIPAGI